MKISTNKFVILFLIAAFLFQFASNSLLGEEIRLFPGNGDWFPGSDSAIVWKKILATIIYPIKFILIGPQAAIFNEPDFAPPILMVACTLYWSAIASLISFLINKIKAPRGSNS